MIEEETKTMTLEDSSSIVPAGGFVVSVPEPSSLMGIIGGRALVGSELLSSPRRLGTCDESDGRRAGESDNNPSVGRMEGFGEG